MHHIHDRATTGTVLVFLAGGQVDGICLFRMRHVCYRCVVDGKVGEGTAGDHGFFTSGSLLCSVFLFADIWFFSCSLDTALEASVYPSAFHPYTKRGFDHGGRAWNEGM